MFVKTITLQKDIVFVKYILGLTNKTFNKLIFFKQRSKKVYMKYWIKSLRQLIFGLDIFIGVIHVDICKT